MLEIRTFYSRFHRPARHVASGFTIKSGMWAYIDSNGALTNIPNDSDDQDQPKVLKMVLANRSTTDYYSDHDGVVGRIATIELPIRAAVDSDGYQVYDTLGGAISYTAGTPLTPAYRTTSTACADDRYANPEDIGKLRPAYPGDIVVAHVERIYNGLLEFRTASPRPLEGDSLWEIRGRGHLDSSSGTIDGVGDHTPTWSGSGDMGATAPTASGAGTQTPSGPPAGPDIGAYEY